MLRLGDFGIVREINERFAIIEFVLLSAGGELLILGGFIILIFELKVLHFQAEQGEFAAAGLNRLRQLPVAGKRRDGAPRPDKHKENGDTKNNAIHADQIVLQPIEKAADFRGGGRSGVAVGVDLLALGRAGLAPSVAEYAHT